MASHPKHGEPTNFASKFLSGQKKHTIRGNAAYWAPKIQEVIDGKAILSIRQWTGKPYRSKQETMKNLTAADGVGYQLAEILENEEIVLLMEDEYNPTVCPSIEENDGLSMAEFWNWFTDDAKVIIIHFTNFRYK